MSNTFFILSILIVTITLPGCSSSENSNPKRLTPPLHTATNKLIQSKTAINYLKNKKPDIKTWSKATAIYLIRKKLFLTEAVIEKTHYNPYFFSNASSAPILVKNEEQLEFLPRNSKLYEAFIDARKNFFSNLHSHAFKMHKEGETIYFNMGTFGLKKIINCSRDKDSKLLAQCKYSWNFVPDSNYYSIKKLITNVYKVYLLPNSSFTRTFALPYPLPIHHGYTKAFTLLEKKYPFYLNNIKTSGMATALFQKDKKGWRINTNGWEWYPYYDIIKFKGKYLLPLM